MAALTMSSQPGQGGDADPQVRDLRAQLLEAEAAHFLKTNPSAVKPAENAVPSKRQLADGPARDEEAEEAVESKRRRVLEETRDIDAASDGSGSDSSDEERYVGKMQIHRGTVSFSCSDDEEDETAELLRELEKIKRERAEKKEQEVSSAGSD